MFALLNLTSNTSNTELPAHIAVGFYVESDLEGVIHPSFIRDRSESLTSTFIKDSKIDAKSCQFRKMSGGKPYLQLPESTYGLSISHTFQYYLIGINLNGEIGVDVEKINRKIHPKLGDRIKNEKDQFLSDIGTLQIWTLKEAVLKLTGSGLRTNMNNIAIIQKSDTLFDVFHENYDISIVSFKQSGCWISVAWTKNN